MNGVVEAEYRYDHGGHHVERVLTQQQKTICSIHDASGNRIAEYEVDALAGTHTLLREYVWLDGRAIAVIENGAIYHVRTDHIGRPVFATGASGLKVWEASYLHFGGVHVATSFPGSATDPLDLRFPGQWFQAESGLHQNWMRDYDPTTGRYIQADPLGLVDGASVYGYAIQSPMRWTDPTGEAIFVPVLIGLGKAALAAYSSYSAANAAVDGYNDLCHSADGLTAAEAVWLALDLIPGGVGKGAKAGASFGDDLASVTRSAPKGGFGPMRRSVSDSSLENILDSYFGQAQVRGQRVGNGGTADALRYERMTGELLSPAGHEQKARDMLKRIEKWRQRAHNAPNPRSDGRIITAADVRYADELIEDLLDALGR